MGALDECHYSEELENGVNLGGCLDLGFEGDPDTAAIEDAVRVLLNGLGEDVNREGLRKTPLRVAKALRDGTRGIYLLCFLMQFSYAFWCAFMLDLLLLE